MRNQKVLDLVYLAIFTGIIFVMAWVPYLGFIPLGFVSVTIIHIPVLIAIFFLGRKVGILSGLAFGVVSWFIAVIRPMSLMDPYFMNPLVSVLPRLLFAICTVFIYEGLRKFIKNDILNIGISSVLGTFIHAVLVLSMLVFIDFRTLTGEGTLSAAALTALGVIGANTTLEATAALLIVTPVAKALKVIFHKEAFDSQELLNKINED